MKVAMPVLRPTSKARTVDPVESPDLPVDETVPPRVAVAPVVHSRRTYR